MIKIRIIEVKIGYKDDGDNCSKMEGEIQIRKLAKNGGIVQIGTICSENK